MTLKIEEDVDAYIGLPCSIGKLTIIPTYISMFALRLGSAILYYRILYVIKLEVGEIPKEKVYITSFSQNLQWEVTGSGN